MKKTHLININGPNKDSMPQKALCGFEVTRLLKDEEFPSCNECYSKMSVLMIKYYMNELEYYLDELDKERDGNN